MLKKMEKEKLASWADQWRAKKEVNVSFDFFGIGEEMNIDEKITSELQNGDIKADIIVSTDVKIFRNQNLLSGKTEQFRSLTGQLPIRDELTKGNILHPGGFFHPCIVVLMTLICNKNLVKEKDRPVSWQDLLKPKWENKVIFSGADKPAGRAFLMGMWYLFGDEGLKRAVKNFQVMSYPSAVLNAVSKGEFAAGVVSLLFTGNQGIENVVDIWPKEGALAVPSYVAVHLSAPDDAIDFLAATVYCKEMQEFYSKNALAIPVISEVDPPQIVLDNNFSFVCPEWSWIQKADMEKLDDALMQKLTSTSL